MRKIISTAQRRVKDSFAPCPKIDLTLRVNGEEQPCLIDPIGNIIRAGLEAPTTAATVDIGAGSAIWEITSGTHVFWNYQYVYVAKSAYPLIENAVTGNGSPAPRSNPSPSVSADSTASPTKTRVLTIPTTSRSDISHIWIYRTELLTDAPQALDFAKAGNLFWIGETTNNPNAINVTFVDANVPGIEQIENDNFLPQQARYCLFADPYFWMIGNDVHTAPVIITATGLVTRTDGDIWFNGRNGQLASFDGITSGGIDNRGNFYVKIIDQTTLQLYLDLALTLSIGVPSTGTTQITIRGSATTLYRSKPRNPHSWGFTDLVNEIQVPTPYNFSVGGGRTKALIVLPNLNLLKIDVDSPARTYTLNLKNAGTPSFEGTLRPIADNYCTSIHFSQFSATVERGRNFIWGLDTKSFAIIQCDGSSQSPISDAIYNSLRDLSLSGSDQALFHGAYLPRLDLNCIFVRTEGEDGLINRCFFQHWPTGYWGSVNVFDIISSATLFDPFTRELKLIVGGSTGLIGEFGAEDQWTNWISNLITPVGVLNSIFQSTYTAPYTQFEFESPSLDWTLVPGAIGNWLYLYDTFQQTLNGLNIGKVFYNRRFARVANISFIAAIPGVRNAAYLFTIDKVLNMNLIPVDISFWPQFKLNITNFVLGGIEMRAGKVFNGGIPFDTKKQEELLVTFFYSKGLGSAVGSSEIPPQIAFGLNYQNLNYDVTLFQTGVPSANFQAYQEELAEYYLTNLIGDLPDSNNPSTGNNRDRIIFGKKTNFPIDQSPVFGIIISDLNTMPAQLMNYEIRIQADIDGRNN